MVDSFSSVRCRVHRGCHEIGGNCVEIEADGMRIVLDLGLPLSDESNVEVPNVSGLNSSDKSLLGGFISHPHPDHYGLMEQVSENVPLYMGEAARRIIEVSSFFTPLPSLGSFKPLDYRDGELIELGPFRVTPFRMDHSAYDSHCFLIEVGGKRMFYSGDLRAHGRQSHLFEEFVSNPPRDIDVLICEGTQIGRTPDFAYPDESSVAKKMAEQFSNAKGMGLIACSGQNVDRVISVFEAAKATGRNLILDIYTAAILRATGSLEVPKPGVDGVRSFLPDSQKSRIKREKAFHFVNRYYSHRIYPEALAEAAPSSVMIFRKGMLAELTEAKCLDGAVLITSMWSGYLKKDMKWIDEMKAMEIEHHHVHTSGHATPDELKRFVAAFPSRGSFQFTWKIEMDSLNCRRMLN